MTRDVEREDWSVLRFGLFVECALRSHVQGLALSAGIGARRPKICLDCSGAGSLPLYFAGVDGR